MLLESKSTNVVQSKVVDTHPLAWLEFTEDAVVTSCKTGMSPVPLGWWLVVVRELTVLRAY